MKSYVPPRPWPARQAATGRAREATGSEEAARQAALLTGLRRAHCSLEALGQALPGWQRLAHAPGLAAQLAMLEAVAAEALHRIDFILSRLDEPSEAGGATVPGWIAAAELAYPKDAEDGSDATLAALAHWALGRLAARGLALVTLAHEAGEYQAAHLLRLSVEEGRAAARGLVPHLTPRRTLSAPRLH
ncbi:hypothetical protein BKE38_03480 [Pseudoroseomonas deserti]|uniref:Uncharacterized protein n=1 Tax=Teichococcus deserti TaxID=1817963 RepID=A0A1V2H6U4_9PROT|nr:hypothetical protein [Pseudoroseomonas deserti]ONG58163.1 hypothetical protein BKE38_03480 [Pseudoroseomonas deserti]